MDEDLNLKIATQKEAVWTRLKKRVETDIKAAKDELMVNKELLKLCERKIKEQQDEVKK